jgi:hypothetical protein
MEQHAVSSETEVLMSAPTGVHLTVPGAGSARTRGRRVVSVADNRFPTDMIGFAKRNNLNEFNLFYARCIRLIYHLLVHLVDMKFRTQMPGDEDSEYQFEYIAQFFRSIARCCILATAFITLLIVGYVAIDALYLHQHGLAVKIVPLTMSNATALARKQLPGSELVTLYENGAEHEQCFDETRQFKQQRIELQTICDWRTLVEKSNAYLERNRGVETCCCAPVFGIDVNHLALEMAQERANETKIVTVHMFNVFDEQYYAYDRLTPKQLDNENSTLGKMIGVRQTQAHLFAWPPAETIVTVVRRDALHLHAINWAGEAVEFDVSGKQAYCVSECIDLLHGVSVYERARRQTASGIKF